MTIQGLPLHPLVVHFAIVLLLAAAGAQILAVVLRRFRAWLGWGLPALGILGAASGALAATAGEALIQTGNSPLAHAHAEWGDRAEFFGFVIAATTVAYWLATSPWGRAKIGDRLPSWAAPAIGWIGLALAVGSIIVTTVAGHTGATAVWAG